MERTPMPYVDALRALDALYAELPALTCQKRCQAWYGIIV
jgi:hypothetical protein